jgi:hypothetical protein
VEQHQVVDPAIEQRLYVREQRLHLRRLERERARLLETDLAGRRLVQMPDEAAVQRHQRQRCAGDRIPLAAEGADHVQREAQRVDHDRPRQRIHPLQAVADGLGDHDAALVLVHGRAVEIGDDGAALREAGFADEALQQVGGLGRRHRAPGGGR